MAHFSVDELIEQITLELPGTAVECATLPPSDYNVAPTREISVFVPGPLTPERDDPAAVGRRLHVAPMHWGLVPKWAKDASGSSRLINARVEGVHERPSYRGLLTGSPHHRCAVPMSGFYEWHGEAGRKRPIYVTPSRATVLCVAALWTHSERLGVTSVTMLTRGAYAAVAPHHDRSPLVLSGEHLGEWLFADSDGLDAARSAPEPELEVVEVSTAVNSVRNNGPDLIRPTDRLV